MNFILQSLHIYIYIYILWPNGLGRTRNRFVSYLLHNTRKQDLQYEQTINETSMMFLRVGTWFTTEINKTVTKRHL